MTAPAPLGTEPRVYEAHAASTATFGRVVATVRTHRLTVDGPVRNGAPGEAPTPGELVLAAVASCAAEVLRVLARDAAVPLAGTAVTAHGTIDLGDQPHAGVTVFSRVELVIGLRGPSAAQAAELVAGFQRRCPVYGSLAVASGKIAVRHHVEPGDGAPAGAPIVAADAAAQRADAVHASTPAPSRPSSGVTLQEPGLRPDHPGAEGR